MAESKAKEIMYLKADSNYTFIYLQDGSRVISSYTLKKFEPKHLNFLRINRSTLVNPVFIYKLEENNKKSFIYLNNGERMEISRRKKNPISLKIKWILFLALLVTSTLFAQKINYPAEQVENCISVDQQNQIAASINQLKNLKVAALNTSAVKYDWPLKQVVIKDYSYYGLSFFVDRNPAAGLISDYNNGTRSYDGHTGTDISIQPFQWEMQKSENIEAIAAADGIIVFKQDGNFDRQCNADYNNIGNGIILQHADGSQTWYWHLENNSLTTKPVGQSVANGEYLGKVGSSGISGGPHLHFEVRNSSNQVVDPFANSPSNSLWNAQKPYWDSQIIKLMTHSTVPNPYPACTGNPVDITFEKRSFVSNETVYFAKYGRDWQPGQVFTYSILKPNGTVWQNISYTRPVEWQSFASNFHYTNFTLPSSAETGTWKFQIITFGSTYETIFHVNTTKPYASKTSICTGENLELIAMNGCQDCSYQWKLNGLNIASATKPNISINQAGAYSVLVNNGGSFELSTEIGISENPLPTVPTLSPNGSLIVCPSTSITLTANNCNGGVIWSNVATGTTLNTSNPGIYTAVCVNGCGTSLSSESFTLQNPSASVSLTGTAAAGLVQVTETIGSTQNINNEVNSTYKAGKSITLSPNFLASVGSVFKAEIGTCQ